MVVHLPSAAHIEALAGILITVAAAAGQLQFFQQMDVLALHLPVPDQVEGCSQPRQTRPDDIGGFLVHIQGLLRMGEGFIGSC